MKWMLYAAAAAIGLLGCRPAFATIPLIKGNYVSTTWTYCQPTLNVYHSNGAVNIIALSESAPTSKSVTLEYYDPRTNVVTITGFNEAGSSLLLDDDINGVTGAPFKENPVSQSLPYSNTLATVTINGIDYHVEWGLRKKNVPQYFVLLRLVGNGCVTQSEKVRR